MRALVFLAVSAATLGVAACAGADDDESAPPLPEPRVFVYDGPPVPWEVEPFPRVVEPADNRASPEKLELGRLLFYDPILSRDHAVACATCHSEVWGLTDGLAVSVGVDGDGPTGPGRVGPNRTTRNALTLWNVAFRRELFWDGRSTSLEEQALMPIEEPVELGASQTVAADLAANAEYAARFAAAFPDDAAPVSLENVGRALAAFQRTFVSSRAAYDQYVGGDEQALSAASRRGMFVFAELGCATCHQAPLFAGDGYFARRGTSDLGRAAVSGDPADTGAMSVPTLRNLRETGPFFHDGGVGDIEAAIRAEVDVEVAAGRAVAPSDDDFAALVSFIEKGLVDRAREPSRPKQVPSGLEVPIDGFRIPR